MGINKLGFFGRNSAACQRVGMSHFKLDGFDNDIKTVSVAEQMPRLENKCLVSHASLLRNILSSACQES